MKKIAFIFPGQGSQSLGMLHTMAEQYPQVISTFNEASDVLGYDLWQLTQTGPEEKLNQTAYTQPALLAASVALWRIWQEHRGCQPDIMAGHSLGEYTALVCTQCLDFTDAVKLVAERGRYMQEAVNDGIGAMAAIIGLSETEVVELCNNQQQNDVLAPANYNAQGQIVIAGHKAAIERALLAAKKAGAKLAKMLAVSVPSHCDLMRPAADKLAQEIAKISLQMPEIPVIHNVDIAIATTTDEIKEKLIQQLYKPVRWVETMQSMLSKGIELAIECGPGKVLSGLSRRIEPQITTRTVYDPESFALALAECK